MKKSILIYLVLFLVATLSFSALSAADTDYSLDDADLSSNDIGAIELDQSNVATDNTNMEVNDASNLGTASDESSIGSDSGSDMLGESASIYVSPTGDDSNDGSSSESAVASISKAVELTSDGGTIYLAAGEYNSSSTIEFNKSISIIGEEGAIINRISTKNVFYHYGDSDDPTITLTLKNIIFTSSGSAQCNNAIINLAMGTNGIISNCTFTDINDLGKNGIIKYYSNAVGSIEDCTFTNINNPGASGSIIYLTDDVTVNLNNNVFTSISSPDYVLRNVIYIYYPQTTAIMNNNSFSDISGKLYYVVEAHGSLIMAKSLFKNISTTMSGTSYSVVATPGSYSNQSSIVSSLFMNNNFNNIFYTQGIYNIESCAIFNNTVSKLINNEKGATVTAENNWWGSNSSIDSSMSDVIPTNYVVMDVSYAPVDEIDTETEVTVTADFTKNDAGSTLENPIPDGVPVELTTIMGTTNPETTTTVNGIATAIYTSSTEGTETITVKQDETSATINFEVVSALIPGAIYVGGEGASNDNNGSKEAPVATIAKAMELAIAEGATGQIIIAEGTYNEHDLLVAGDLNITAKGNVIIDGEKAGIIFSDRGYNLILDGLTLINGLSSSKGGALYISYGEVETGEFDEWDDPITETIYGSLIANNCNFFNNSASYGGAIALYGANADLSNCVFESNNASYGGALSLEARSNLTADDCDFIANNGNDGAVLYSMASNADITDSEFYNNTATRGLLNINGNSNFITNIKKSVFMGNSGRASLAYNYGGLLNISSSIIENNPVDEGSSYKPIALYNSAVADLNKNYWGTNSPDFTELSNVDTVATNWIIATIIPAQASIENNSATSMAIDFNKLNDGTDLDEAIPDGYLADLTASIGIVSDITATENGMASALYTANEVGIANIGISGETIENITVVKVLDNTTTSITVEPKVEINTETAINVEVLDVTDFTKVINAGTVVIVINDGTSDIYTSEPLAVFEGVVNTVYTFTTVGTYTITATYSGNEDYKTSEDSTTTLAKDTYTGIVYVSSTGVDTNKGSFDAPVASLEKAIEIATGEDGSGEIIFIEGTYIVSKTTVSSNLKISGEGNVILDANGANNHFTLASGGNLTLANLTLINGYATSGYASSIDAYSMSAKGLYVYDCNFVNNTNRDRVIDTQIPSDIKGCQFINNSANTQVVRLYDNNQNLTYCVFINNRASGILYSYNYKNDINYNYWGFNTKPSTSSYGTANITGSGASNLTYWVILEITPDIDSISSRETQTFTVGFDKYTDGSNVGTLETPMTLELDLSALIGTLNQSTVLSGESFSYTAGTMGDETISLSYGDTVLSTETFTVEASFGDKIYVGGEGASDDNDGSINSPVATIAKAFEIVAASESDICTVFIANGDYTASNISLPTNISVNVFGAEKGNVRIKSDNVGKFIFSKITGDSSFMFENITFMDHYATGTSGALRIGGTGNLDIINCTFTNITGKYGIQIYTSGVSNLINNTFTDNKIVSSGSNALIYIGSGEGKTVNIIDNLIDGLGLTDGLSNSSSYYGAIYNYGSDESSTVNVINTNFTNINGPLYAVVVSSGKLNMNDSNMYGNYINRTAYDYYGYGFIEANGDNANIVVRNSSFHDNVLSNSSIYVFKGSVDIEYSAFYDNTPISEATVLTDVLAAGTAGTVNAEYNWWGSNDGPSTSGASVSNWVIMNVDPVTANLDTEDIQTITVDFNHYTDSSAAVFELAEHIPELSVSASAVNGDLNQAGATTVNGVASFVYTATVAGEDTVTFLSGAQSVPVGIVVTEVYRGIIYVSPAGSDDNNGAVDSPVATIAHAIDLATATGGSGVVFLLNGTHTISSELVLSKNINITSEGGAIVDGQNISSHIRVSGGTAHFISNITFINGKSSSSSYGGSVYATGSSASTTITNCKFINNSHSAFIVKVNSGVLNIYDCEFINNTVTASSGVACIVDAYDDLNLNGSKFISNTVSSSGYATLVYIHYYPVNVSYCMFVDNDLTSTGSSALEIYKSSSNSAIYQNYNYWGTNTPGTANTNMDLNNWVILEITPDISSILPGETQTFTVSFDKYTDGSNIGTLETPMTLELDLSALIGTVNESSIVSGESFSYTATAAGDEIISLSYGDTVLSTEAFTIGTPYTGIIYVGGESALDTNDGSVDAPLATIAKAIEKACGEGLSGQIIINEGTYTENNLIISDDLSITGLGEVVIDGTGATSSIIVVNGGDLVIDNIAFKNANVTSYGAAINVKSNANSNVLVKNSKFENLTTTRSGAIYVDRNDGTLVVDNCSFVNISANTYGAVTVDTFNNEFEINISNSEFKDNFANNGAALYFRGSSTNIVNNTFINNFAKNYPGAIRLYNFTSAVIDKCYFENNTSNTTGSYSDPISCIVVDGATSYTDVTTSITSCVFVDNKCTSLNAERNESVINIKVGNALIDHCVFVNNTGANNYAILASNLGSVSTYSGDTRVYPNVIVSNSWFGDNNNPGAYIVQTNPEGSSVNLVNWVVMSFDSTTVEGENAYIVALDTVNTTEGVLSTLANPELLPVRNVSYTFGDESIVASLENAVNVTVHAAPAGDAIAVVDNQVLTVNNNVKTETTVGLNASVIDEDTAATITVTVVDKNDAANIIAGTVVIVINNGTDDVDTISDLALSEGSVSTSYTFENPGTYTITATYAGGEGIDGSADEEILIVNIVKSATTTSASATATTIADPVIINVEVSPGTATGKVEIVYNGVKYTADVVDGQAVIKMYDLAAGTYDLTVSYTGDDYNNASLTSVSFEVNKLEADLEVEVDNISIGESATIKVYLSSDSTLSEISGLVLSDETYSNYFADDGTLLDSVEDGTVFVVKTLNNRDLIIDKAVTIVGDSSSLIVNGTIDLADYNAGGSTISGLTIINVNKNAINMGDYVTDVMVSNNIINIETDETAGTVTAVFANGYLQGITIANNTISLSGAADYLYAISFPAYTTTYADANSENIYILNNDISINADSDMVEAIYLSNVQDSVIENNIINEINAAASGFTYGIQVSDMSYWGSMSGAGLLPPSNISIRANTFNLSSNYMIYGVTVISQLAMDMSTWDMIAPDSLFYIEDNLIIANSQKAVIAIGGLSITQSSISNNTLEVSGVSIEGVSSVDNFGVANAVIFLMDDRANMYASGKYAEDVNVTGNKIKANIDSFNIDGIEDIEDQNIIFTDNVNVTDIDYSIFEHDAGAKVEEESSVYNLSGTVIVSIDGVDYTVDVVDGFGSTSSLNNLTAGIYNANASFVSEIYSAEAEDSFTVTASKPIGDLVIEDIVYNADAIAEISLKDRLGIGVNATVTLIVDGKEYPVTITDGVASIPISGLAAGEYAAYVVYEAEDDFLIIKDNFTVAKSNNVNVEINVGELSYGGNAVIDIQVSGIDDEALTGIAAVSIGDSISYVAIVDGVGTTIVSGLNAGSQTVSVEFFNNENYTNKTASKDFSVDKVDVSIEIDVDSVVFNSNLEITAIVSPEFDGQITFTVTGDDYSKVETLDIINGKAVLAIDDIVPGDYDVEVVFEGNDNYNHTSATAEFTFVNRTIDLKLEAEPIVVNVNKESVITVTGLVDGPVAVYDNGVAIDVIIEDGSFVYVPATVGQHEITLAYEGSELYDAANASVVIRAVAENVVLLEHTGDDVSDIQAAIDAAQPGDIIDLGDDYDYVDIADINITKDLTITSGEGVSITSAENADSVFNIVEDASNVTITGIDFIAGDDGVDFVSVQTSENDNGISDIAAINITGNTFAVADGVNPNSVDILEVETDSTRFNPSNTIVVSGNTLVSGIDSFELNIAQDGDDIVIPKADSVKTSVSVNNIDSSSITAVLRDVNGNILANRAVSYTIDGVECNTSSDENGLITVDGLTGSAEIVITYAGDDTYASSSAVVNFFIKSEVATIIECDNMTTTTVKSGERTGEYFIAKLTDINGNALSGKKVQIGFNGKIYERTTNETGEFRLQVNLAKAGGYTFAISFLGDDDYSASFAVAKITVKA